MRGKYARKKVRLNWVSNSQPPGHESDKHTTEPPVYRHSFGRLMIALGQDSFLSHHCPLFRPRLVRKQPVAWKEYCAEYWLKELQESMYRCTGHHHITKILLKMALNTIQSLQGQKSYLGQT